MPTIRVGTAAWITSGGPTQDLAPSSPAMTPTPKFSIIQVSSGVANDTLVAPYRYGLGVTDGTTKRSIAIIAESGQVQAASDQGGRYDTSSQVLSCQTNSNALEGEAEHSSFAAGKQVITTPDFALTQMLLGFTLFAGDDVEFAIVDYASSGTQDVAGTPVSSLSFTPNFVMAFGRGSAAFAADTAWNARSFSRGYAVKTREGNIEQFALADVAANNTTAGRTILRSNRCATRLTAGADQGSIELTSWDAAGATFTDRDASDVTRWVLVFARFAKSHLRCVTGTLDTDATGNKNIAVGFPTKAYFFVGTELSSLDASSAGADTSTWSHATVDEVGAVECIGVQSEDNAATGDSRSVSSTTHVAAILDNAGGVSWSATHVSKDTTDIVVNVDDASAADRVYGLLAISEDMVDQSYIPATRRFRRQLCRM